MSETDYYGKVATPEDYLREKHKTTDRKIVDLNRELARLKDELALEQSLGKWYDIFNGVGVDLGGTNCALCQRHKQGGTSYVYKCENCVVGKKVNARGCSDTPYIEWIEHHRQEHESKNPHAFPAMTERKVKCYKCVVIAGKEIELLKSCKKSKVVLVPKRHSWDFASQSAGRRAGYRIYNEE